MAKKTKTPVKKHILRIAIWLMMLVLILIAGTLSYLIAYNGKIYPNVSVAGINVSGNTAEGASLLLSKNITVPSELILIYQDQTYKINTKDISVYFDFPASASEAYKFTRSGNFFYDIENRVKLFFSPEDFGLVVNIDKDRLAKITSIIAGQISIDPVDPSVTKTGSTIVVSKGLAGREVDQNELVVRITKSLSQNQDGQIPIPVDNIDNILNDAQSNDLSLRAEKFLDKSLTLKFEYNEIVLKDSDIFKLLDPHGDYKDSALAGTIEKTVPSVERDPQNPKFVFANGKVTEFQPALDGIKIDRDALKTLLTEKLTELSESDKKTLSLDIPVVKAPPEVETGKVNDFGIKELIGRGTSIYFHSIPGRVHNIALAASRINGTLVKPGETFSFNNTLGDVSAFTGYQQAYIISEGKTILGDGGGVCQVSTTLFRAVLNAGLPVVERQAHAYRVGYYEQDSPPGIDATVFSPSPDFKFTNDTGHYVLIETKADTKNYSLVFELYGTSDGRVSSISKPVVTNVTAPPPDLYQDDPTLPAGVVKQVDYKAWGAKVTFNYTVTRGGQEIINKTFVSNYKAWQAIYLRGTGPAQ